ncbi:MAG: hypothetical protein Q4E62_04885, partial [Sutterellaceae bacterium]|nr:hypothetical protein [Sutterellaceae bacterium]
DGKENSFASELDAGEALAICTDFAKDSFEQCPSMFLMEFNGSILVRDAVIKTQRFTVTKKIVDAAVLEATALNRIQHPALYDIEYKRVTARLRDMIFNAKENKEMEEAKPCANQ